MALVIQACDPNTQDAETGGWQVQGQPRLYSQTLSQKNKGDWVCG
jgi:hypothetical protein